MAITTNKRKSESALPTGRNKQRKTNAVRRQDSDSSQRGDDSSDRLFIDSQPVEPKCVKKTAPKSRKSEPVMRVTKADEYDEDEGRIESQQFLALIEFESKKKRKAAKAANEYMDKFTKHVNGEEQALKKYREKLSAASAKLDKEFLEAFTNAYAASRPSAPPSSEVARGKAPAPGMSFATLYERSKRLTSHAFNLIDAFETANDKTTKIEIAGTMSNYWEEENDTAEKVIAVGRMAGLQKYEALTMGEEEPEIDADLVVFSEAIYKQEVEIGGIGWGRMAKKQIKAVKKLNRSNARETTV